MGFTIKGVTFDREKAPVICVPVVAEKKERILEEMTSLVDSGISMIEWRADYFEGVGNPKAIEEVLKAARSIVKNTVLLFTVRTKFEGGQFEGDQEAYINAIDAAVSTGVCDMADIEFLSVQDPKNVVDIVHSSSSAKVILSHHDFEATEEEEVLAGQLEDMNSVGADIVKLAVMPQTIGDVLTLLYATAGFAAAYPDSLLVSMSMGKEGMISRISGEIFGSCITFASMGNSSAPGQLPYEDCRSMIGLIHRALQKG